MTGKVLDISERLGTAKKLSISVSYSRDFDVFVTHGKYVEIIEMAQTDPEAAYKMLTEEILKTDMENKPLDYKYTSVYHLDDLIIHLSNPMRIGK